MRSDYYEKMDGVLTPNLKSDNVEPVFDGIEKYKDMLPSNNINSRLFEQMNRSKLTIPSNKDAKDKDRRIGDFPPYNNVPGWRNINPYMAPGAGATMPYL